MTRGSPNLWKNWRRATWRGSCGTSRQVTRGRVAGRGTEARLQAGPSPWQALLLSPGPMKLGAEAAHLPHLRPLPESQPPSSPLLQTAPGIKGHQRVVTLAQHISVSAHLRVPNLGRAGGYESAIP